MKFDRLIAITFLLPVIAILFVVSIVVYDSAASSFLPTWNSADNYAPSGLMSQFEKDSLADSEEYDTSKMAVQKVSFPGQSEPLYFIDARMFEGSDKEPLCGAAGCLFSGYVKTGWREFESVFELYLHPYVPPEHELIWADATMRNEMPVLYITQRASPARTALVRATLVFNGDQYVVTRVD